MRLASDKSYEMTNGDSVRIITDDLLEQLNHMWAAAGDKVPATFRVMVELEA